MNHLCVLVLRSAQNRRLILGLMLTAISLAVMLRIERLRHMARQSCVQSMSGVVLFVDACGRSIQVMLNAVSLG